MHEDWDSDNDYDDKSDSESIESQIDSEIEIALYGKIHHISDLQNPDISVLSHTHSEVFGQHTIQLNPCKLDGDPVNSSSKSVSDNNDFGQSKASDSIHCSSSNKQDVQCIISSDSEIEVINVIKGIKNVITVDDTPDIKKTKRKKKSTKNNVKNKKVKQDIIKTLATDVISISSSSDEWLVVDSLSTHSNEDISINVSDAFLKFLETDNNSPVENWVIDPKDKYVNRNYGNRYYKEPNVQCKKCSGIGHSAYKCPIPKKIICYLCGENGHFCAKCKKKVCSICGSKHHSCNQCQYYTMESCERCGVLGHLKELCPDIWRQYYLTTELCSVVRGSLETKKVIYCYNCSKRGHLGHLCPKKRMYKRITANIPFIIKYDDILFSKKKKKKRRKGSGLEKIKEVETIPVQVLNQISPIKNFKKGNNKKIPISVMPSSSVPLNSKISLVLPSKKVTVHKKLLSKQNKPLHESSAERTQPVSVKSTASFKCAIKEVSGRNTSQNEKLVREFKKKYKDEFPSDDNSVISRTVNFEDSNLISKNNQKLTKLYNSTTEIISKTVILDKTDSDFQVLNVVKKKRRKRPKKKPFFRIKNTKNIENSRGFQLSENAACKIFPI